MTIIEYIFILGAIPLLPMVKFLWRDEGDKRDRRILWCYVTFYIVIIVWKIMRIR